MLLPDVCVSSVGHRDWAMDEVSKCFQNERMNAWVSGCRSKSDQYRRSALRLCVTLLH